MNDSRRPPRMAEWILARLLPDDHWQSALGDFEEQFRWMAEQEGEKEARRWYRRQILRLVPERTVHHLVWGTLMIQNYLTMALRHIRTNLGYASINILGLAVGLASFAVIGLYVADEYSYDRYHEKADRIYRVLDIRMQDGVGERSSSAPSPLGDALLSEFGAQVEQRVRFFNFQAPAMSVARIENDAAGEAVVFNETGVYFTDESVFEVFDWTLEEGDPATALASPFTTVITREMAGKYFPRENPVGKTLRLENEHDLTVTGVLQSIPSNSHFRFDFLVSFSTLNDPTVMEERMRETWVWNPTWTYLLLRDGAEPAALEAQFPEFVQRRFPESRRDRVELRLQPLTEIHLTPGYDYEIAAHSDVAYVYLFSAIAVFILVIAGINFVNLSTARATMRAGEVGIRKVLGAHSRQVFRQFLGESIVWGMIAVVLAVPLIWLALPVLNSVSGKSLTYYPLGQPIVTAGLLAAGLTLAFIAGLFPAFILARYETASALKGARLGVSGFSTATWRKTLVVGQFALSVLLIGSTLIVDRQLEFLRGSSPGFDAEQVILLPSLRSPILDQFETFKSTLLENPNVEAVSAVEEIPGVKHQTGSYLPEDRTQPIQFPRLIVHDDFAGTMGIDIIAGRGFTDEFPNDPDESLIVNEALVRSLGWGSPEAALGRRIDDRRITGVVGDFHFSSLHRAVGPFLLTRMQDTPEALAFSARYIAVRAGIGGADDTIEAIESLWHDLAPGSPFEAIFLDSAVRQQYAAEETFRQVAGSFSALAIFLASLGLLGLVAFMAGTRRKEFGIRKVNGATPGDLIILMAGGFLKLVILAVLIAWPITYVVLDAWLSAFAYRVEIETGPFLISGLLVIGIAASTLMWHTVLTAFTNPADSLRSE